MLALRAPAVRLDPADARRAAVDVTAAENGEAEASRPVELGRRPTGRASVGVSSDADVLETAETPQHDPGTFSPSLSPTRVREARTTRVFAAALVGVAVLSFAVATIVLFDSQPRASEAGAAGTVEREPQALDPIPALVPVDASSEGAARAATSRKAGRRDLGAEAGLEAPSARATVVAPQPGPPSELRGAAEPSALPSVAAPAAGVAPASVAASPASTARAEARDGHPATKNPYHRPSTELPKATGAPAPRGPTSGGRDWGF
ncbi:MAG: hypothetical protein FJ096_21845 [Deltaproteobacteria bacterium]|nr:hypothetical protein [Deltaproteobacteria bacterium]